MPWSADVCNFLSLSPCTGYIHTYIYVRASEMVDRDDDDAMCVVHIYIYIYKNVLFFHTSSSTPRQPTVAGTGHHVHEIREELLLPYEYGIIE